MRMAAVVVVKSWDERIGEATMSAYILRTAQ
jgi:hypothetical protein